MLCAVTNRSSAPRGFATLDRGVVLLDPGEAATLDLADHPSHRAWAEAGAVTCQPLSDKDARAARRRLDAEAAEAAKAQGDALSRLPPAIA